MTFYMRSTRGPIGWMIGGLLTLGALAGCGGKPSGPVDPGQPTSIEITPAIPSVEPGTNQQFTAMLRYSGGTATDVTQSVTWSSSDDAILTISNGVGRGLANRLTDASVDVTATLDGLSGSIHVDVWCTVMASTLRFDQAVLRGFGVGRLVADANAVYWAAYDEGLGNSGGSIATVSKSGTSAVDLATGLGGINAVVSDGVHVYWTEYDLTSGAGAVKRVPITGGAVEILASGTPAGSSYDVFSPGGIAVDATYVYWGESTGGGAIRRVPKAGGTVTDLGRGQGFGPSSLTISGGYLYGVTNNGGVGVAARLPVAGGTVEVLGTGVINASNVAVDGTHLYWAEVASPGRIMKLPVAGGTATPLATDLDNPHSVEVHGGFAFYSGATGTGAARRNGVWKVAVAGGSATLVVANAGTVDGFVPHTVAADATHLFLVDAAASEHGHARVLRAPRE